MGALEPASALSEAVFQATGVPPGDQRLLVQATPGADRSDCRRGSSSAADPVASTPLVEVLGPDGDACDGYERDPERRWVGCLPGVRDGQRTLVLSLWPDAADLLLKTVPAVATPSSLAGGGGGGVAPLLPCHPVLCELHRVSGCRGHDPRAWHFNPGFGAHRWLFGDPHFGALPRSGGGGGGGEASAAGAAASALPKPPCMFQCRGDGCGGEHGLAGADVDACLKAWGLVGFPRFLATFATQWPGARPAKAPYHRSPGTTQQRQKTQQKNEHTLAKK